jgi:hypothetical protein
LKVHQETKQQMRRLVQGVLAFLSVAMYLAVWNNKDRANKRLVRSCDKRAQESPVMSLYGKQEVWAAICRPMGRSIIYVWKGGGEDGHIKK